MSNSSYQSPPEQHTFSSYPTQYDTVHTQPYLDQILTDVHGSLHPQSYTDHDRGSSSVPPADAVSIISAKPEDTKPVLESHIAHTATSQTDSVNVPKPHLLSERNDFILDWALKILGVAAAILFGIWAPISYKITADGNAGNDEAQASLMSAISSMRDEARTAAFAQRSAVTALSKVQDQLANIGLLRAYEICLGESAAVCKSIMSHASIEGALSSLGGLISSYSSSAAPSATGGAGGNSGGVQSAGRTGLGTTALVAVILGAVFGGIVIIGLIVGVLARRQKLRKNWEGTSM